MLRPLQEGVGRPRLHLFVCTNKRPIGGRPSCGTRGSEGLIEALRAAVAAQPDLWGEVRINGCDCLGPCFDGPNLVVYPEGTWYAGVDVEDVAELVAEHFVGGRLVTRLLWEDDE